MGGSGKIILYDRGERCRKLCQLYDKFMFVFEMKCFVYISEKKNIKGIKIQDYYQCIEDSFLWSGTLSGILSTK